MRSLHTRTISCLPPIWTTASGRLGRTRTGCFTPKEDYGLFQSSEPCYHGTYDNGETIRAMVEARGFRMASDGSLALPEGVVPVSSVPTEMLPRCPRCGKPMTMNLRADDRSVEDAGRHQAAGRYRVFLSSHATGKVVH